MCGRYRLSRRAEILAERFSAEYCEVEWEPRYNIAPTQQIPVIRQDDKKPARHMSLMKWGLVPYWATDSTIGTSMINARSETAALKPAFKESLLGRRCLIPADSFYEWKKMGTHKQPYSFEVGESEVFAFAGLWDRWQGPGNTILHSCTILTTTPNRLLADVHDRMPVILSPEDYAVWLDPGFRRLDGIMDLLKPYDANRMRCYPVSPRVNNVGNDDIDCAAAIELTTDAQARLF